MFRHLTLDHTSMYLATWHAFAHIVYNQLQVYNPYVHITFQINKRSNSNVYEFIRICKVVTPKPGMGFTGPKIKNNDKRHMIAYELQIFESRTATWHPENWG